MICPHPLSSASPKLDLEDDIYSYPLAAAKDTRDPPKKEIFSFEASSMSATGNRMAGPVGTRRYPTSFPARGESLNSTPEPAKRRRMMMMIEIVIRMMISPLTFNSIRSDTSQRSREKEEE